MGEICGRCTTHPTPLIPLFKFMVTVGVLSPDTSHWVAFNYQFLLGNGGSGKSALSSSLYETRENNGSHSMSGDFMNRPSSPRSHPPTVEFVHGGKLRLKCTQPAWAPPGCITTHSEVGGLPGSKAGEAGDMPKSLELFMKLLIQAKLLMVLRP